MRHSANARNCTIIGSGSFAPSRIASHGVPRAFAGLVAACSPDVRPRRLDRAQRLEPDLRSGSPACVAAGRPSTGHEAGVLAPEHGLGRGRSARER